MQNQATMDQVTGLREALTIIGNEALALKQAFEKHVLDVKTDILNLDNQTVTRHNDLATRHNTLSATSEAIGVTVEARVSPIVDEWPDAKTYIDLIPSMRLRIDATANEAKWLKDNVNTLTDRMANASAIIGTASKATDK